MNTRQWSIGLLLLVIALVGFLPMVTAYGAASPKAPRAGAGQLMTEGEQRMYVAQRSGSDPRSERLEREDLVRQVEELTELVHHLQRVIEASRRVSADPTTVTPFGVFSRQPIARVRGTWRRPELPRPIQIGSLVDKMRDILDALPRSMSEQEAAAAAELAVSELADLVPNGWIEVSDGLSVRLRNFTVSGVELANDHAEVQVLVKVTVKLDLGFIDIVLAGKARLQVDLYSYEEVYCYKNIDVVGLNIKNLPNWFDDTFLKWIFNQFGPSNQCFQKE